MKRVRIIVPFDGYAVGDTPEFFGHVARQHVAEGRAEDIEGPVVASESTASAKPRRRKSEG